MQGISAAQVAVTVGVWRLFHLPWHLTPGGDLLSSPSGSICSRCQSASIGLIINIVARCSVRPNASSNSSTRSPPSRRRPARRPLENVTGPRPLRKCRLRLRQPQRRPERRRYRRTRPARSSPSSAHRQRQIDSRQPHPPLLRRHRRAITIDGHRRPRCHARLASQQHRHRPAGRLPLHRHYPRQHRLRPPGCDAGGHQRGREGRPHPRLHRQPALRLRRVGGRTRRHAFGRPEATHRHRSHPPA